MFVITNKIKTCDYFLYLNSQVMVVFSDKYIYFFAYVVWYIVPFEMVWMGNDVFTRNFQKNGGTIIGYEY
jgi:hypothetical protein